MPKYVRKEKAMDRAAISELALGVLSVGWVKATNLAELIGCSVQQLHAALTQSVADGVFEKVIDEIRVGHKEGRQPRVMYRRAPFQPRPLPEWLDPAIVPPAGVLRAVSFFGEDEDGWKSDDSRGSFELGDAARKPDAPERAETRPG